MSEMIVGTIDGYDVLYIPERDAVFCKNTSVSFPVMKTAISGAQDRYEIEHKNLTIIKNNGWVELGCLSTTLANCQEIIKTITTLKKQKHS